MYVVGWPAFVDFLNSLNQTNLLSVHFNFIEIDLDTFPYVQSVHFLKKILP